MGKFNNLALYAGHHADSDEKRECSTRGLPMTMRRELFLGNYQSFPDLLNVAITLETLSKGAQSELGQKRMAVGSSSHPPQKVQVVRQVLYHLAGNWQP